MMNLWVLGECKTGANNQQICECGCGHGLRSNGFYLSTILSSVLIRRRGTCFTVVCFHVSAALKAPKCVGFCVCIFVNVFL